ncbi:PREDICTED: ribonuclease P protein subunit p29 [Polistes canadensis]|uniref:ribonuclease P protein subunit p29 n=1 Tax=Polistes canadensis TaxID=91411 RepID=UPI000718FA89|nr:PREDICTED: ribonuclease P protein subunit p29 [Polistes canadensis]
MEKESRNVCLPLSVNLTKSVTTDENNEKFILTFLQNLLPPADRKNIADELRKNYIFSKIKSKTKKNIKLRKKYLTSRKRIALGLGKIINKRGFKYTDLLPLHELWLKYIQSALGDNFSFNASYKPTDNNWETINNQLIKADFHGAKIAVVKSKCPSLIGINGIIVQDTKNTFRVCCTDDIIRTLPKESIVINLYLHKLTLQIYGKQLSVRPIERTVKKFKNAYTLTL